MRLPVCNGQAQVSLSEVRQRLRTSDSETCAWSTVSGAANQLASDTLPPSINCLITSDRSTRAGTCA